MTERYTLLFFGGLGFRDIFGGLGFREFVGVRV